MSLLTEEARLELEAEKKLVAEQIKAEEKAAEKAAKKPTALEWMDSLLATFDILNIRVSFLEKFQSLQKVGDQILKLTGKEDGIQGLLNDFRNPEKLAKMKTEVEAKMTNADGAPNALFGFVAGLMDKIADPNAVAKPDPEILNEMKARQTEIAEQLAVDKRVKEAVLASQLQAEAAAKVQASNPMLDLEARKLALAEREFALREQMARQDEEGAYRGPAAELPKKTKAAAKNAVTGGSVSDNVAAQVTGGTTAAAITAPDATTAAVQPDGQGAAVPNR